MGRRKIIDISTEEKKKQVFDRFNSFTSKNQAHEYFGISDNKQGSEYLKEIAASVGFDLNLYKERRKKPIRYCKECGKEIISQYAKDFCCRSCAVSYNNRKRSKKSHQKLSVNFVKEAILKEKRYCVICGKELKNYQTKYCSVSCRNRNKYLTEGQEIVCQECGKTFKSRDSNRKFCSNKCASEYHKKIKINQWLEGKLKINPNRKLPQSIREYLLKINNNKCQICGFEGYNRATNNSILQIHHVDGNCGNNSIENIQLICPNCHAMTENYMALNKGNSARDERYRNKKRAE